MFFKRHFTFLLPAQYGSSLNGQIDLLFHMLCSVFVSCPFYPLFLGLDYRLTVGWQQFTTVVFTEEKS